MTQQLGEYAANATVQFKWNTTGADGASIARSTDGSIRIYKDASDVQRTSSNGITDTEGFDGLTGVNHLTIDLSDDTDSGFYDAGHEYDVVLVGAVIDGKTVNAALAHFSIERNNGILENVRSVGTSIGTYAGTPLLIYAANTDSIVAATSSSVETISEALFDEWAEPTAPPDPDDPLAVKISRLHQMATCQVQVTASAKLFYDSDDLLLWQKALSDDGTTYTEALGA